jgi:MFS family permease
MGEGRSRETNGSGAINPGVARSSKTWVLLLLMLMAIFLNADNLVLSPNLTAIENEFGVTDSDIGNISGLFTVVGAVISLLWGYLADKGSRKLLFVLSIIIGELPCALTAFAQDYTQFFILRILCGIGVGASYPIAFSLVADFFSEKERAKATGLVAGAIGCGQCRKRVSKNSSSRALSTRAPSGSPTTSASSLSRRTSFFSCRG